MTLKARARVAVIAGSKSDETVINDVTEILKSFNVPHEAKIISAHRDRAKLEDYVGKSDVDVFIGIAGLSAHLPGALASLTSKPVIGVPVSIKLGGMDSLLSIVQMPPRVPVACVGIDNGKNAAFLAIEILSLGDSKLRKVLERFRVSGSVNT